MIDLALSAVECALRAVARVPFLSVADGLVWCAERVRAARLRRRCA